MKEIIISISCAIISGIVSWTVSKQVAKAEINKLQEIWKHEKETAYNSEFDDMISAVSLFARSDNYLEYKNAVEKIAVFRAKSTGKMGNLVDKLDSVIVRHPKDLSAINSFLKSIIEEKRKMNSH